MMLKQYIKNPKETGMIVASSKKLAQAMTRSAKQFDHIVEIGAGTGAITDALLSKISANNLHVIEYDAILAESLRTKYFKQTKNRVLEGPAHSFEEFLSEILPSSSAIISSLPFKSLPQDLAIKTIDFYLRFVSESKERAIFQYSYILPFYKGAPFPVDPVKYHWSIVEVVIKNVPPAKIWKLSLR